MKYLLEFSTFPRDEKKQAPRSVHNKFGNVSAGRYRWFVWTEAVRRGINHFGAVCASGTASAKGPHLIGKGAANRRGYLALFSDHTANRFKPGCPPLKAFEILNQLRTLPKFFRD